MPQLTKPRAITQAHRRFGRVAAALGVAVCALLLAGCGVIGGDETVAPAPPEDDFVIDFPTPSTGGGIKLDLPTTVPVDEPVVDESTVGDAESAAEVAEPTAVATEPTPAPEATTAPAPPPPSQLALIDLTDNSDIGVEVELLQSPKISPITNDVGRFDSWDFAATVTGGANVESIVWYYESGEVIVRGQHQPLTIAIDWQQGMDRLDVIVVVTDKDGDSVRANAGGLALRCSGTAC